MIDYSQDHDLIWVVAQTETRQLWCWRNADVLIDPNITLNRLKGDDVMSKEAMNKGFNAGDTKGSVNKTTVKPDPKTPKPQIAAKRKHKIAT